MKHKFMSMLTMMLMIGIIAAQAIKVHTIGDSTMAQYDPNSTVTRGWGQYLQQFLEGVTVNNRGKEEPPPVASTKERTYGPV